MTRSELLEKEENVVLGYAVYRNSLVFLFRLDKSLRAGVLVTQELGLRDSDILFVDITSDKPVYESPRTATVEDFEHYRISPKGHLL